MFCITNLLNRKQKGIGLLELMLSLAIIAICCSCFASCYRCISRGGERRESGSTGSSIPSGGSECGDCNCMASDCNDCGCGDCGCGDCGGCDAGGCDCSC